ncbi:MAG: metal-dependent hydrolase [Fimbriimonadales bacterium]|nr:metal-dependent hydrolase [Fimbriimonadales bacterium]
MQTQIQWLGHSTFLITSPNGKRILIDPWVQGNPACPDHAKQLPGVDIMLITHGHSDHCADAVALAKAHEPTVACIFEMYLYLNRHGVQKVQPMNKGGSVTIDGITVTMVNAFHSSGSEESGQIVYLGDPAGYVVRLENGLTLYHAGDTCVFGDMRLIGELYQPDIAMLPIGDVFTMGPREAAYAIRLLGVKRVIPMHWGTFPLLTGTPDALREATRDIDGLEIIALQPGETIAV